MAGNEDFLSAWRPVHEKGMFGYLIPHTLPGIAVFILAQAVLLYLHRPVSKDALHDAFISLSIYTGVVVFSGLTRWIREEKRYRRLTMSGLEEDD